MRHQDARYQNLIVRGLLWVLVGLIPSHLAQAKGGIFNNPIFGIVTTVALVAVSMGALAPVAAALDMSATYASVAGAIADVTSSIDAFVGIEGFTAAVGIVNTGLSLATAGACLDGQDSFQYSGCGGGNSSPQPAPTAAQQQAAINANTLTIQSQGNGPTCPSGSHFVAELAPPNQCLSNGYNSCASVGHPDLVCPVDQQCTADGQCQAEVNGSNCKSNSGQSCQSASNSCGMTNIGTAMCDGSCPAPVPSDSVCLPPSIQLSEVPSLVNPGSSCTVSWTVSNATKCTLSSDTSDPLLPKDVALPSGSYQSQALQAQSTYTLSCQNGTVVTNSGSIICHINPQFQAI